MEFYIIQNKGFSAYPFINGCIVFGHTRLMCYISNKRGEYQMCGHILSCDVVNPLSLVFNICAETSRHFRWGCILQLNECGTVVTVLMPTMLVAIVSDVVW